MLFGQIFTGVIIVVAGYFLTTRANWLMDNFGRIAFFEQHLGTEGGTRLFYKLLGITTIVGGFMYATGILQTLVLKAFTPFFGAL